MWRLRPYTGLCSPVNVLQLTGQNMYGVVLLQGYDTDFDTESIRVPSIPKERALVAPARQVTRLCRHRSPYIFINSCFGIIKRTLKTYSVQCVKQRVKLKARICVKTVLNPTWFPS
jgi:hypothetical protein